MPPSFELSTEALNKRDRIGETESLLFDIVAIDTREMLGVGACVADVGVDLGERFLSVLTGEMAVALFFFGKESTDLSGSALDIFLFENKTVERKAVRDLRFPFGQPTVTVTTGTTSFGNCRAAPI